MRNMDPMPIALRRLITESGLTDTEVWAAANITSGGLSHYLSGNRGRVLENRAAKTVRKLARVFDVAPDYFVRVSSLAPSAAGANRRRGSDGGL